MRARRPQLARGLAAFALGALLAFLGVPVGVPVGVPAGLPASPAAAQPAPDDALVSQVRQLLSGVEAVPPAATWRALGSGGLRALVALYQSPTEPPFVRARAVSAAAHYPVPAARTFLKAVAGAPGQDALFVRRAVRALGAAFGAQAEADLRPYLAHPAPAVRVAAARALAPIDTPSARAALRERRRVERARSVREALDAALTR
ncbi:MAG TPA: HEAT repeat domain-containing protein [Polyangiaceae bacterium LLY-WYZ-15_(1-7)]|nr:HEAT repeat domain-containing protein [Polyangiaceae bacterium LLY-WYZ-15_(1-7)]HJL13734.1 HEAT repeat domain-containing protein [Polyangiaceae bacterium LLY-WYZ-15_(1-7)]HJL22516.1 HEAT repeat domain-containing protein [Polyangiaceae bacterium LLY-WYZ-15_(1-7)]